MHALNRLIDLALEEDIGTGDITTETLIPADAEGDAALIAKEHLVLAGIPVAQAVFKRLDPTIAFPEQLADGRSDLQTRLVFKVMPNGEIRDLFFADRSGNSHFDESAFRAVMKSDPVDPHPESVSEPYVQMGLRFTPEGIQ